MMLVPTRGGLRLCSTPVRSGTVEPSTRGDTQTGRAMSDTSRGGSTRAAPEAQDAIASRPRGSRSGAVAEAMRRYLSSETYDQLRRGGAEKVEDEKPRRDES